MFLFEKIYIYLSCSFYISLDKFSQYIIRVMTSQSQNVAQNLDELDLTSI